MAISTCLQWGHNFFLIYSSNERASILAVYKIATFDPIYHFCYRTSLDVYSFVSSWVSLPISDSYSLSSVGYWSSKPPLTLVFSQALPEKSLHLLSNQDFSSDFSLELLIYIYRQFLEISTLTLGRYLKVIPMTPL